LKCSANKPKPFEATEEGVDFSFQNRALFLASQIFQVMYLGRAKKAVLNICLFKRVPLYEACHILNKLFGVFDQRIIENKLCRAIFHTSLENEHSKNKCEAESCETQ
jgi:hypothetical protein